jgi:P4 family phage/plasmid primase-like protien
MDVSRKLGCGRNVTQEEREVLLASCIGDNARIDLVRAANALAGFFDGKVVFQAVATSKGWWRHWAGTHWAIYNEVLFNSDLDWLFGGRLLARHLKELIATVQGKLAVPNEAFDRKPIVTFENCVLEIVDNKIRTYTRGFAPEDYVTTTIPVRLTRTPTPKWDAVIERVLPNKTDRACFQECLGYVLFPGCQLQTFFALVGPAGSGKSTVLAVLRHLLGESKVASIPLSSLHQPHATAGLADALVNIDTECEFWDSKGEAVLKALTGCDPLCINPKYLPTYSKTLPCKVLLAANEMPRIQDKSEGVWSRLVTIPFSVVIPPRERKPVQQIIDELRPEFGGIAAWGLKGLSRVLGRGTRATAFSQSETAKQQIVEHRRFSNPFEQWIDEAVEPKEGAAIPKQYAYQLYREWCNDRGYKALADNRFGGLMMRTGWIGEARPHRAARCYTGVSLRQEVV